MIGKSHIVAVAAVLVALATAGGAKAAPANSQGPGFEKCFAISLERGAGPNMGGGTREHSQHNAFMDQCLSGKIPMEVEAKPSALNVPANAHASAAQLKRSRKAVHAR